MGTAPSEAWSGDREGGTGGGEKTSSPAAIRLRLFRWMLLLWLLLLVLSSSFCSPRIPEEAEARGRGAEAATGEADGEWTAAEEVFLRFRVSAPRWLRPMDAWLGDSSVPAVGLTADAS